MHDHDVNDPQAAPVYHYPAYQPTRVERFFTRIWSRPSWLAPLAVLSCMGLAGGYVLAFDPSDATPDPVGPCAFRALTGLDCPGCGGTRMVWFLLHGDLLQAARHHLAALIVLPVLLYAYLAWAGNRLFHLRLPTWTPPTAVWVGYLVGWAVFSVVRNLPWDPFLYFRV